MLFIFSPASKVCGYTLNERKQNRGLSYLIHFNHKAQYLNDPLYLYRQLDMNSAIS